MSESIKKIRAYLVIFLTFLLIPFTCIAGSASGAKPIYFDFFLGSGFTQAKTHTANLIQYDFGATLAARYKAIYLGGVTDYQYFSQISQYKASVGNQKGTRFNFFAPCIGVIIGQLLFKAEYEFLGEYSLALKTARDNSLSYRKPTGYRFSAFIHVDPRSAIGFSYQTLAFAQSFEGGGPAVTQSPGIDFQTYSFAMLMHL